MHRIALSALAVLAVIASSVSTAAETAPADAIKYRKAVMSGLSAHVNAFLLLNTGKVEHQDHLKAHANALADLGGQVKVLFPAGSDAGTTDALPLLWQEREQAMELATKLESSSAKVRDAIAAGDKAGAMAAFKLVGEACKGCHDRYRKSD